MPTRKINDPPQALQPYGDSEHDPPRVMCPENGIYEHECPSCGNWCQLFVENGTYEHECSRCEHKYRFFVRNPTLTATERDPDDHL